MFFQKLHIKVGIFVLIGFIIISLGIYYRKNYENLSDGLVFLGGVISISSVIIGCYLESIYCSNKKYIEDVLMYKKGYTYEVRLPKNTIEDKLFRKFANKEMIKELDSYLEYNKSVKIFNTNYNNDTIKKLIRK